jgi:RecA/RadA recombinase
VVRARKNVLWIDLDAGLEHMDDAPRVIVARPRCSEEAFRLALAACQEPSIGLVIMDPTQHLVREAEIDGDPRYVPHPQREYRMELNALKTAASGSGTAVLFVSQPRDKERQPVRGTGISEKVVYRVHLHPDVVHQDGSRVIQVSVKHVPGKVSEHDVARFLVEPRKGINQMLELVRVGLDFGVIHQRGSWVRFSDLECQGANEMARLLATNRYQQRAFEIDEAVRRKLGVYDGLRQTVPG